MQFLYNKVGSLQDPHFLNISKTDFLKRRLRLTENRNEPALKRNLKSRHIEMISLGCAIGTGLFYGASSTIQMVGPAVTLAYAVGGFFIYLVVRALAEMAVYQPVSGSFSTYAYRYWGNFPGFFSGWNYWFLYVAVSMAELSVIGIYVQHWLPDLPTWIPTLILFLIINAVNLMDVGLFGELEFWGSFIKVAALAAMIVFGLLIILFGVGRGGEAVGFANLWAHGGFLPNGIRGLLMSLVVVTFSFGGTELIGITAGEAEHPEKTIPKSVNMTIGRILIFYVGAVLVLVTLYPWNEVGTKGSPFVEIFDKLGIPAAADLLNIVVIIAVCSAYNSSLYSNARMLRGLALHGDAPAFLAKLSKNGVPYTSVLFSSFFVSIVIFLCYLLPQEAFGYIMGVTTVAVLSSWILILLVHIRFRRAIGAEAERLVYKAWAYPWSDCAALLYFALILGVMLTMDDYRLLVFLFLGWLCCIAAGYAILQHIRK